MKRLAIIDDWQNVALSLADWSALDGDVEITVYNDHLFDEDAVAERLAPYEIVCIMRERTPFPRSLVDRLPKLEHLFTSGVRNRSIDLDACRERGIVVSGVPTLDHPTPELTIGLLIALARHIVAEDNAMRAGKFQTTVGTDLKGRTLGLVGLGRMGSQVARIAQALQMNVIAWSTNLTKERCDEIGVTYATAEELFSTADFVSIHLIMGQRNIGLITGELIGLMKPDAYFINTSRGPIVDEAALIEALENERIAGAGIDVYDVEPLPHDHKLRQLPNTVLTPHLGYVSIDNYRGFFEGAVANIRSWLDGKTINELK